MKISDPKGPNFEQMAKTSTLSSATFNKATLEKNPEILKNALTDVKSMVTKLASPPAGGAKGIQSKALEQLQSKLANIAQMVSLAQV